MTSQPKVPAEPVGIELLLELLNASEGIVDRDALRPEISQPIDAGTLPPAFGKELTSEVDETPVEIDDTENRFAAHIIRGMSKSKTG